MKVECCKIDNATILDVKSSSSLKIKRPTALEEMP
jgi:hypothetical protein